MTFWQAFCWQLSVLGKALLYMLTPLVCGLFLGWLVATAPWWITLLTAAVMLLSVLAVLAWRMSHKEI